MEKANADIPTFIEASQYRIDALWWTWLILTDDGDEPRARALVTDWLIAAGLVP